MSVVTVRADSSASLVANMQLAGQNLTIDETGMGQQIKSGPDPYDYIMGALGACTVITLQLYAQRKQWPLEQVSVTLQHERVHPQDCEQCHDAVAKLTQITKRLYLQGNLTADQRQRLEDISARCPVQKTLEAGILVKTILEPEGEI
jgi:putative redox protein